MKAIQLLNISLRGLHVSKQPAFARPLIAGFQSLLRETAAGEMFFQSVAKPQAIKNVLSQAYYDSETVTDELVECLLKPGMEPGAARVFLDFIRYACLLCGRQNQASHSTIRCTFLLGCTHLVGIRLPVSGSA